MIIGDSTARGGYAFHPGSAVAPAADEGDDDDGGEGDLEYLDDAPINPTAVRAILSSADEPPHQIHSYTLLFSLFLRCLYITDPPLRTSAPT